MDAPIIRQGASLSLPSQEELLGRIQDEGRHSYLLISVEDSSNFLSLSIFFHCRLQTVSAVALYFFLYRILHI